LARESFHQPEKPRQLLPGKIFGKAGQTILNGLLEGQTIDDILKT
jgi:hypothetical protein